MMKMKQKILVMAAVGLQFCASSSFSQEEERAYDASISLGYVGTTGNTETETFNTEFLYTLRTDKWTHNVKFQALGSREDDATTAERYYLDDKSDYNLDENQYLFVQGSYTDDRFSGFDYQAAASAGYGRYFIKRENYDLQGYAGIGYRESNVSNFGSDGEAIFTLGQEMSWAISENSSLSQSFTSEIGDELTVTKFDIALESNIIGDIASRISFQIRNNSEVPPGIEKTDTQTSISLAYTF